MSLEAHILILDKYKLLLEKMAAAAPDLQKIHEALEELPENSSERLDNEEALATLADNWNSYATSTEFEIQAIKTALGIE